MEQQIIDEMHKPFGLRLFPLSSQYSDFESRLSNKAEKGEWIGRSDMIIRWAFQGLTFIQIAAKRYHRASPQIVVHHFSVFYYNAPKWPLAPLMGRKVIFKAVRFNPGKCFLQTLLDKTGPMGLLFSLAVSVHGWLAQLKVVAISVLAITEVINSPAFPSPSFFVCKGWEVLGSSAIFNVCISILYPKCIPPPSNGAIDRQAALAVDMSFDDPIMFSFIE